MEEDAKEDENLDMEEVNNRNQIVEEERLLSLFNVCRHPNCGLPILRDNLEIVHHGFYLKVIQRCTCANPPFKWESTDLVNGKVSQLDLSSICAANTNGIPTLQINDFHRDMGIVPL